MKISCIIPTCNRNNYLIEAINSVLNQTLPADEIIVINNGESAVDLSNEIKGKVKVYNIVPYAGASQARNFGASVAKGDYLAFLDDDDLWNKKYLANALDSINKGAKCVVSRIDKMVDGEISSFKNAHKKLKIKNLLIHNPGITGSNLIVFKDAFLKIGGFNPKLPTSEDKALMIEFINNKIEIITLPGNQAIRRIHKEEQLTGPETIAEGIYQFTRIYKKLMNKKEYLFNYLKIYKNRYKSGEKRVILNYITFKIAFSLLNVFSK